MDINKDYYAVLGVLPSIDADALKAVYRALIKKYHPDTYIGDKTEAEAIARELNEAYQVLITPDLRREYDLLRCKNNIGAQFRENRRNADDCGLDDVFDKDWEYLRSYFPEVESCVADLTKLSSTLAFAFKVEILQRKTPGDAFKISNRMREEFLTRYFGSNSEIKEFVAIALRRGNRKVAIELNQAINSIGSPRNKSEAERMIYVAQLRVGDTPPDNSIDQAAGEKFVLTLMILTLIFVVSLVAIRTAL